MSWAGRGSRRAAVVRSTWNELDAAVAAWIGARPAVEVIAGFEAAEAAIAPIEDVRDLAVDPQYAALGSFPTVDDPVLGPIRMQGQLFRLSATPGTIRWTGREPGADTDTILREAGLGDRIVDLRAAGVIA